MEKISILVLFALTEEREYFIQTLNAPGRNHHEIPRLQEHRIHSEKNGLLSVFSYTPPEMGNHSIIKALPEILEQTAPSIVINVGIAGAIDHDAGIGDVVIGTSMLKFAENSAAIDAGDGIAFKNMSEGTHPTGTLTGEAVDLAENQSFYDYELFKRFIFLAAERELVNQFQKGNFRLNKGMIVTAPFVSISDNSKQAFIKLNRKARAVEMEAYFIQEAINVFSAKKKMTVNSLFLKGISDMASASKERLDSGKINRKLAMVNTSFVFQQILDQIPLDIHKVELSYEHLDLMFNARHLADRKTRYWFTLDHAKSDIDFEKYSYLWQLLIDTNFETGRASIFESLMVALKPQVVGRIEGFSGSGRSSFIIIFYHYIRKHFPVNDVCPIYINLDYYYEVNPSKSTEQAASAFMHDMHNADRILRHLSPKKVVLLIDGLDYKREQQELIKFLEYDLMPSAAKFFGVVPKPEKSVLKYDHFDHEIPMSIVLKTKTFDYPDPQLKDVIKLLFDVKGGDNRSAEILKLVQAAKLQNVDVLTLQLIDERPDRNGGQIRISRLFENYCNNELSSGNKRLDEVTKLAFEQHITTTGNQREFRDLAEWKLLYQNPRMTYYLIAKAVISKILSVDGTSDAVLYDDISFVFPYDINYFTKEIINETRASQDRIFRKIRNVLGSKNWQTKAIACYLAGRFTDAGFISDSKMLLKNFLATHANNTFQDQGERSSYLFALRTVYISLAYLGDGQTETDYIRKLIQEKDYDDINRGFHLVYYGDQEYDPKFGLAQQDFGRDFDNTFRQLLLRVRQENKSNIFNIEMFTLVSLAMHRLKKENLAEGKRAELRHLLTDQGIVYKITNGDVASFVKYAKPILEKPKYSLFTPLEELYNLKFLPRSGWVNRKIAEPETVAAHTLMTFYLAKFYLPETVEQFPDYSKQKILDMILIHDIAESRIGDIILKNETDVLEERLFYEDMRWVSYLLENENSLSSIDDMWDDFEFGKSINGRIARELDRLEGFIQLLHYKYVRNADVTPEMIRKWYLEINNKLEYECTKRILKMILRHYDVARELNID